MIKIHINDTVLSIVKKIQNTRNDNIILEFPFWHPILHNFLSLKLIKNKAKDKSLTIITSDLTSRKIWKPLWIEYSIIKDKNFLEKRDFKQDLLKHNFTFIEYFNFLVKKYFNSFLKIFWKKSLNPLNRNKNKHENKTNLWFFLLSLIISILLFLFIFYFAVNKTTVYITPEIEIRTKAKNFIFKENLDNVIIKWDKYIEIKPISNIINLKKKFSATWIDENSTKKSRWEIMFYNKYFEEIKLLPKTRLITKDWVLFETPNWVIIPPAIKDNFWKTTLWRIKAEIVSKNYDMNWNFIWKRWNIWKNIMLSLPWLKSDKNMIIAKTISDIKWWDDKHKKLILETDIKHSREILESELKDTALKNLKISLEKDNKINNSSWEILLTNDVINYSNLKITDINWIKAWTKTDSFELEWEIHIKTYIYNEDDILNKLKNTIRDSIIIWSEKILSIDKNSLRIATEINRVNKPLNIKATVEINFLISHDFANNKDSYTKKLKSTIRWVEKEEAINLLLNDKKVSNVDIKIRPFFIKKISNIVDNITFKINNK